MNLSEDTYIKLLAEARDMAFGDIAEHLPPKRGEFDNDIMAYRRLDRSGKRKAIAKAERRVRKLVSV